MFGNLFKKTRYATIELENKSNKKKMKKETQKPNIPNGLWEKCNKCGKLIFKEDLIKANLVCKDCGFHFRMGAKERIKLLVDKETFYEMDKELESVNPLDFPKYKEKLETVKKKTNSNEGVITGIGKIDGNDCVIAAMDSKFLMGSMGSVVGEKITRAIEKATEKRLPILIVTASGGARMQEGIFSLMQMAKTSAALAKHNEKGLLHISILTDPTTGGVIASFAMLGDIILAEPGALIGFAGPRVIEQTIKKKLPDGFQRSEFLLEHGFIDKIIKRKDMKKTLGLILSLHKEVD